MRRFFLARLAAIAILTGCASTTVLSQQARVPAADARAAQAVVRAQLEAFAADDAQRAFSYAAPHVREMFGTPDRFMHMVRTGYAVVYRPASVNFMPAEPGEGGVLLRVQMTDKQGASWLATYLVLQQQDKSWLIGACVVAPNQGRSA